MLTGAPGLGTPSRMHGMEGSLKYSPEDLRNRDNQALQQLETDGDLQESCKLHHIANAQAL